MTGRDERYEYLSLTVGPRREARRRPHRVAETPSTGSGARRAPRA
ncbi:hypothetical protein QJS66_04610 [Kocuria rhizophila]|nr:hypothetical protein QJS66_04610 [Kocuria rhizophila]